MAWLYGWNVSNCLDAALHNCLHGDKT
jgi:hypothetical protein